ncbi:GvpL/GvpF family gas vesicle protein [Streptomyces sp. RFCAC02]|uniref:GvpL/GvpF family gas vesicle protein n=1 Tax=Streptomyces sp. RFCAC02 TaxID=2499143 RepID=UPI001021D2A5|nr:GvpL/GvpF family gas vesicle protein [Streptomyces sp. RFCAC02]
MSTTATCVFAVCPADAAPALARRLTGPAGHTEAAGPVRALPAGPLTAVVQSVPADAFTPEALRERLADRAALERCARAHDEVVATVAATAATVPLPLATLYLGDERAAAALAADAARLLPALVRVAGRDEWGVKVTVAPAATAAPDPEPALSSAPARRPAPPSSGRAYLERVRDRGRARDARRQAALDAADRVEAALRPLAAASRALRLQDTADGAGHQILNTAHLVDRTRAVEFTAAVAALRRLPGIAGRVTIGLTGPWAPYSFAAPDAAPHDGGPDAQR